MSHLALSRRWRSGMGTGKSLSLRAAVSGAIESRVRPLAYLPTTADIGLRSERVDLPRSNLVKDLGVDPLIGRLTRNLSSGERQRVRLAAAFSSPVGFAALDEPCRHLDPDHVGALNDVLSTRVRGGMDVAACDARSLLHASLFERDDDPVGEQDDAPVAPAAAPAGDALELRLATPFLLSSESRKTSSLRLRIERGALVVVRGPNGSGKTSLLHALAAAAKRTRCRVGFSRQEPEHQVFTTSLHREMHDVMRAHEGSPWCQKSDPLEAPAPFVNLGLRAWDERPTLRLPLGVLGLLGTTVALWMGHDLVLLDEPSQMLDVAAAKALGRELKRCAQAGARIVVATHDPEILRVANRAWQVDAGQLDAGESS